MKKSKIAKRKTTCFTCSGQGEKSNYTGEGESGYSWGQCGSCKGKGWKMITYEICNSCNHSEIYFSPATRAALDRLASKR